MILGCNSWKVRWRLARFANPAVTIARVFSDTLAGIAPASVPMFLLAQIAGGAIGYGLARAISYQPTLTAIAEENRHELDAAADRSSGPLNL